MKDWIQRRAVTSYVLLAYGITWLLALPLVLAYNGFLQIGVPFVIQYVLPYGPLLSALIVTWARNGMTGLREIFSRMSKWRIRPIWILTALFSVWVLYFTSVLMLMFMGQPWPDLSVFGEVMYLPYLTFLGSWALWIFTYGIGEETGWRGFLLPQLQTKYNALVSSLILSIIWAGWHIPMFLYNENLMAMGPFGIFGWVIGLMFGAVLMTFIYNNTEGSILMTAIWHGTFNLFTAAVDQAAGVTSGIISMLVMFWAVLIVIVYKPTDLSRLERQRAID